MPINISKDALSAIKIGESDLVKAVVGINEIFPNNTQLTGFTFVSAATVPQAGANRTLTVSGDVGSSFTLTGTTGATGPSGTQTLAASPTNYTIPISANSVCGAALRRPIITIAAQGNTVYGATFPRNPVGSPNYPDPILTTNVTQVAGPAIVANNVGLTISATNVLRYTVNIGGQLYWAPGSQWRIDVGYTVGAGGNTGISRLNVGTSFSATVSTGINPSGVGWTNTIPNQTPVGGVYYSPATSGYWDNPDTSGNNLGTGSYNSSQFAVPSGTSPMATVSFSVSLTNAGCNVASPSSATTGLLYP